MKMDGNWFWILFWIVVVVGCTTNNYLDHKYDLEQKQIQLEQMKVMNLDKENK